MANADLGAYRELFPITESRGYLNHAALGPLSRPAADAIADAARKQCELADYASAEGRQQRERTREKVARLIGARPEEVAPVRNTPDALSMIAGGVRWRAGDVVVTSDQEFPANIYPWMNLTERGVEVVLVPSRDGRVPLDEVLAAIDARTRLVALSWVEFSTGFRNDVDTIAEACRQNGALFSVDGIQGVGALAIDVKRSGIDFMAFSSHKWMLGPQGVGWIYCRNEMAEELDPVLLGPASVKQGSSWLDYTMELWPNARRFETGGTNAIGLAGVEAAVDIFLDAGPANIEARIKMLTDRLSEGLLRHGYKPAAARGDDDWSGIVSFSHSTIPTTAIHERLEAAKVATSVREGRIRVSPHFYNTTHEIDRLLEALP